MKRHPQFHSKLEGMLEDVFNKLEPEVSAAVRKEKNDDSCPICGLSNDSLKHIFGYVGEMQYGFVACVSCRFHQAYLEMFENETMTSIENAVLSVSCAKLCLDTERPDCNSRAKLLFQTAASDGKLEVLKWGQGSRYELKSMLEEGDIADAAFYGHMRY